ncbi:MAG: hypothetical protein WB816_20080 [Methylocystis sp.]
MSVQSLPALGTLQLMAVAKMIVWTSPWGALAAMFGLYVSLLLALAYLIADVTGSPRSTSLWSVALLGLSYPSLFMLDRGNFHSGYASVAVAIYLLTAFTGKRRWVGFIALIYAINVRPNEALITIIEFALADGVWRALGVQVGVAAASVAVWAVSLVAAHAIDPSYTLDAFIKAYGLYHQSYIFQDGGLSWNDSLYGAVRSVWSLSGAVPSYNAAAAMLVTICGVFLGLGYLWLALTRRLTPVEAIFLAVALCALFTPVLGHYHALMLAGPALVLLQLMRRRAANVEMLPIAGAFAVLPLLSLLVWLKPSELTAIISIVGAVFVSGALWRLGHRNRSLSQTEGLILGTSLLSLCPLGGALTNGLEISTLLVAASIIIIATSWKRSGAPIAFFPGTVAVA